MPALEQLWRIYFVKDCRHTLPDPKDKYVIATHIDGDTLGFLINSQITPWVQRRPHLLVCEAPILAQQHSILRHDSIVDCRSLYPFTDDELTVHKGMVSAQAKSDILKAIAQCPVLLEKHKIAILARETSPPPTNAA